MEFCDTVSDATLITEAITAALESSKEKPDDDSFPEKVKDMAIEYIIGGTLGGLATVGGGVCMYFRNKVCGQTDDNQQPNATVEAPIEASTSPNLNPLQATVGYSNELNQDHAKLLGNPSWQTSCLP